MFVSCFKILVVVVLVQYVTSVEFYKSKRVPPKYKEIRRTYSLKLKDETVDSKPADTPAGKDLDEDTFIGNVETTNIQQTSSSTITLNDNDKSTDAPLENKEKKIETESVETVAVQNSNQNKEFVNNTDNVKEELSLTTTTIKPKRRPFNLRKISKSSDTNINGSNGRDEFNGKVQTNSRKQYSSSTGIIAAKRLNIRPFRNKEENVQNKTVKTLVKEDIVEYIEPIDNIETTEIKKPLITTTTIKTNRRLTTNLRPLKNRVEKGQGTVVKIIDNVNTDEDQVSNENSKTTREKTPVLITNKIKPLRRTFNSSFKRKEVLTNSTLVSSETAKTTENKKITINTRTFKAKVPTTSFRSTSKKNEQKSDSELVKAVVDGEIDEEVDDIQIMKDKKSVALTKSEQSQPSTSSLHSLNKQENTDGLISSGNLQRAEDKSLVLTSSIVNAKIPSILSSRKSLEIKEEEDESEFTKLLVNNVKVSNDNTKNVGDKKYTVTANTAKLKTSTSNSDSISSGRNEENTEGEFIEPLVKENVNSEEVTTLNLNPLKNKEENEDSEYFETIVNENTGQIKLSDSLGNVKLSTTSVKPEPSDLGSSTETEKSNGESVKTIVKQNTGQINVSQGPVKLTIDNKLSAITATVKPKTLISSSESVKTVVNDDISQTKTSIKTITVTEDNKVTVSNSTTKSRRRPQNRYSSKRRENNSGSQPITTTTNEEIDQDKVTTSNARTTEGKKLRVTSSIVQPQRRTSNLNSFKQKKENISTKPITENINPTVGVQKSTVGVQNTANTKFSAISHKVTPQIRTLSDSSSKKKENKTSSQTETFLNENIHQEKVSISNVQNTEDKKLDLISSTIKPSRQTLNLNSLKQKDENTNSQPIEVLIRKNISQEESSNENLDNTADIKFSPSPRTVVPQTRTAIISSSKKQEENTNRKQSETIVSENMYNIMSTGVSQISGTKKLSLISSTIEPQRRTSNLNYFQKSERNTNSQPIETVASKNIHQERASTGGQQNTGDINVSIISHKTQSHRRTLNLDSLKVNEDNSNSKSVNTHVNKNFDNKQIANGNTNSKQLTTNVETSSDISTEEPKILTASSAISQHGNNRIIKTQRKIIVQDSQLNADAKFSTQSTISNKDRHMMVVPTQASRSNDNYYQTSTHFTQLQKSTQKSEKFVPIVGVENYVYAYNGDYHYSYEGGDGTKAFERGELKSADGNTNRSSGVVGGYSYKDKDGNDFNLSYTAGEGGYQPVGAHLPTSPPIPPAIQRVLRILATKTTPEPVTEKIKNDYRN